MGKAKFRIEEIGFATWIYPLEKDRYFTIEEMSEIIYSLKGKNVNLMSWGPINRVKSVRINKETVDFHIDQE